MGGTPTSCVGGPTPWNSGLTCEATSRWEHTVVYATNACKFQHGWVFEVPALNPARPVPLMEICAFSHEAHAADPATGIAYETEGSTPSGVYRYIPNTRGRLETGGRLQMMRPNTAPNANVTIQTRGLMSTIRIECSSPGQPTVACVPKG